MLKNTLLPFPKYAATFVYNGLADHNVLADLLHITQAAGKGDADGVFKGLSGLAVNGTGMYVGYHMAQSGLITNKDAEGYSDSGLYLHIGKDYIPLGLVGMAAMPVLAGAALQQSVTGGGNPGSKFIGTVGNTLVDTVKEGGAQSLIGGGNQVITDANDALAGKDGVTWSDTGAEALANAAGQYIPAGASDLNSFLNYSSLNPSGEAPLTKVTKGELGQNTASGAPSTAKDIPASALQSLKSRIPFESQNLPRNPGVAATSPLDRGTGGDHATQDEINANN